MCFEVDEDEDEDEGRINKERRQKNRIANGLTR